MFSPGAVDSWLHLCRLLEEVIQTMCGAEIEIIKMENLRRAGSREESVLFEGAEYIVISTQENYKNGIPYKTVRLLDKNKHSVVEAGVDQIKLKKKENR